LSSRLPIPVTKEEETRLFSPENNTVLPFTKLRMLRPGIARAIIEDGVIVVYHCMDNSRLVIESDVINVIIALFLNEYSYIMLFLLINYIPE
jgi:hypothetical protein